MKPWGSRERKVYIPLLKETRLGGDPSSQPEGLREPFELPHPSGPRLCSIAPHGLRLGSTFEQQVCGCVTRTCPTPACPLEV